MSDKLSEIDEIFGGAKDKKSSDIADISFKKDNVSSVALKEKEEKAEFEKEDESDILDMAEHEALEALHLEKKEKEEAVPVEDATAVMSKDELHKKLNSENDDDVKVNKDSNSKIKEQKESSPKDEQKTMVVKRPEKVNKTKKIDIVDNKSENKKSAKPKKKNNKKAENPNINTSIFKGFLIAFGVVIVAFVLAIGGLSLGKEYLGIDKGENNITFNIPKGSTNADIADLLEENDIIESKTFFKLIFRLKAPATVYPGDITLQPSMGYSEIIDELATMRESYKTAKISFPEGVTLYEVANLLEKHNVCKAEDFLFEFNKDQGYDFEKEINGNENAFYDMEGYFFPDTYEFYVDDTGFNITKTVRDHFQKKFTDSMLSQMKKQGLTMNQLMTLASMVQWESGSVEDMPKVASVFLNRLNDPDTFPTFQSDATKKYIDKVIKKAADTTAEIEHYEECYDTYNYKGLPSGPVCNPGIDAIKAVLNPAKTDYYYFCNNLKTKESFFAKTLEEHEKNLVKAGLK